MASSFELSVDDLFHLPGQGTVVSGTVAGGRARVGEKLEVSSPEATLEVRLLGIESLETGEMARTAETGDRVGLLLGGFDPERLPGGATRTETGWELVSLMVRARPRRGWWSRFT